MEQEERESEEEMAPRLINRGVLIYWIGKISAADMAKFSVSAIGIF